MLSTLPFANMFVNTCRAVQRLAAQGVAAFVPPGNLTPMISEVLCYGCMAGIAMPVHHVSAACDRGHIEDSLIPGAYR
ncbi:hypothetical protein ACLKMY_27100 [Paraburkholderia mimosarum]|uniref:hypothetical protein n=1 Tax=Paraburkholderia mimosarum TaxID=312026 RepID=UPI0039C2BFB3